MARDKSKRIIVARRSKKYGFNQIITDGDTFLEVQHEDPHGGFTHSFGPGMTKELFRKLKQHGS